MEEIRFDFRFFLFYYSHNLKGNFLNFALPIYGFLFRYVPTNAVATDMGTKGRSIGLNYF